MIVAYRMGEGDNWSIYRCDQSGRIDLDLYESNYRCRVLVSSRVAIEAQVMSGTTVVSRWVWRPAAGSAYQEFGPDL